MVSTGATGQVWLGVITIVSATLVVVIVNAIRRKRQ